MAKVGDLSQFTRHESLDTSQPRDVALCPDIQSLYWIEPIDGLPRVDLSKTFASSLCCRNASTTERQIFNSDLVVFVNDWVTKLQVLMVIACPSIVIMFFAKDSIVTSVSAIATFLTAMPMLLVAYATLSVDMTKLVIRTFEFWFLTIVNIINTIVLFSMLRDARIVGIISSSIFYQVTLFSDANLRTRLVELRFLVFGAPAMLIVTLACVFRVVPGLHSTSILGTSMSDVDLLINGNFIIAFFTMRKTHCNRHLLWSKYHGERHIVQCQMYFPVCRMAISDSHTVTRLRLKTADEVTAFTRRKTKVEGAMIEYEQTLHMVPSVVADAVNVDNIVFPWARRRRVQTETRLTQWIVNSIAVTGIVCSTLAHVMGMLRSDLTSMSWSTRHELVIEIIGLVGTLMTFVWYISNCQRDLLQMIAYEVDAWFAAIHFTLVGVCVSDILQWRRDALPVLCAWFWSLWILLLDALPPTARRRLGFQRWFLLLVNILLMLFHVSLLHALFFSTSLKSTASRFQNRILVDLTISIFKLRLDMFSFVASKIFTSFVWMGRFMWREKNRPRDAFKLIKHRVQFLIPSH